MMIWAGILLTGGICAMPQPQNPAPSPGRQPSPAELVRLPVVYRFPGMDDVQVRSNIVYKRAGNEELMMDVYSPRGGGTAEKRPAVVFIHGGPIPKPPTLQPKDWTDYICFGKLAAASGFVGVTFNHRFFGLDRLADAQGDIDALVDFIRGQASTLGIDEGRLAFWAFSGGGSFLSEAIRRPRDFVRCLLGFYSIMDLRPFRSQAPAGFNEDVLASFSPVVAIGETPGKVPPVFIGRAGLDNPVLNAGIDEFMGLALKKNIRLTVRNHPEGYHGFDVRNDDATSRDIIREAFAFLKAHLI
ncbi:MAG: alpha/beta hydrolase [Candidatus Aminicenantales bacterium]